MRGHKIRQIAEEFEVSFASACRMRTRYLLETIAQGMDYIDGFTDEVIDISIPLALKQIVALRKYEAQGLLQPREGAITDEMIQRAKEYPVDGLFELKNGRTQCPFHNSKGPDLSYHAKTNTVRCFGSCGKSWNPIDVLICRDGYSFVSAVKYLSK